MIRNFLHSCPKQHSKMLEFHHSVISGHCPTDADSYIHKISSCSIPVLFRTFVPQFLSYILCCQVLNECV